MSFPWNVTILLYWKNVDYAIIEVGLGGRLDATNIINPILSVITNISYDHTEVLGDTLEKIAFEKAGIIKQNTNVIIGERDKDTENVFIDIAKKLFRNNIYVWLQIKIWKFRYRIS